MSNNNYNKASELVLDAYQRILLPADSVKFTKWPKLNECMRGLRPREYTILCGATGAGKTSFLAAMASDLVQQNIPIFVASVETGPIDFVARMISCLAQENWNLGDPIDAHKLEDFRQKHPWFEQSPLHLTRYEDRVPNAQLLGDIKHAVDTHGVKVAMLDNLNFFMEVTTSQNQIIEMDRVIHDAIIFCKQNDVHLIVVMHPKKTENGRVESEFDIKGSSTAVQEAHNVWLFNRPPLEKLEEDPENKFYRELKIAKCRRYGRYVGNSISFRGIDGVDFIEEAYGEPRNTSQNYFQNRAASYGRKLR